MTCSELCGGWSLCSPQTGAPGGAEDRDGLSGTHLDAQQVRLVNDNGEARLMQHLMQHSMNPLWEVLRLYLVYSYAGRWHRTAEDCSEMYD